MYIYRKTAILRYISGFQFFLNRPIRENRQITESPKKGGEFLSEKYFGTPSFE